MPSSCAGPFPAHMADLQDLWRQGKLRQCSPERPTPLSGSASAPALPASADYLNALFKRFIGRLTATERRDLKVWIEDGLSHELDLGTMCSGTDGPVLVWQAFGHVAEHLLGARLRIKHHFSCEKKPAKQQFIMQMFDVPFVFEDCCELQGKTASECRSQTKQPVPDVAVLLAGFPCTDVSSLNRLGNTPETRSCIGRADLRTGAVFAAICQHINAHKSQMQFIILENVCALARPPKEGNTITGPDNLSVVVHQLGVICDCWTKVFVLDPRLFGVPQCRPRLWLLAIPRKGLCEAGLDSAAADKCASDIMQRLAGGQLASLDDYLLHEQHPLVRQEARQAEVTTLMREGKMEEALLASGGVMPKRPRRQAASTSKWPSRHIAQFEAQGFEWWSRTWPSDATLIVFPGLYALAPRQFEILKLMGITEFPEREPRSVDLSQTVGRSRVAEGFVHTLTPTGQKYLTHRCRFLHGVESLRLQSLWFDADAVGPFGDSLLRDLAGNAFEGSCCAASVLVCCTLAAKVFASRLPLEDMDHCCAE